MTGFLFLTAVCIGPGNHSRAGACLTTYVPFGARLEGAATRDPSFPWRRIAGVRSTIELGTPGSTVIEPDLPRQSNLGKL
jgi:hypothetical protein